jgi:ubiquinone/menaquinone biosynthesis C-methylase UbiE
MIHFQVVMKQTNYDDWKNMVDVTTPAYAQLFAEEKTYLQKSIAKDSRVLEVGCGYGRSINDILTITQDIAGIDHDAHAVLDARIALVAHPSIWLINAEATQLPFFDNSFDYVVCLNAFVNFGKSKYLALGQMKRVLKDDGRIIISAFSEDALEERLKVYRRSGIGFSVLSGGTVIFENIDKHLGDYTSEQFSKLDLEKIFTKADLKIEDTTKAGIAYLCTLKK